MELTPGYKQTEVGVIPEDWEFLRIGDLNPFITSGSRGWAKFYSDRGSPFIRITNMSRESIYLDPSDLKLVNLPPGVNEGTRTQLLKGDVLVSITADVGIIGYVDDQVSSPAYINQHIALVRLNAARANSHFVSYFLASENPQKLFRGTADLGAKAGMSLQTVREIALALPSLPEQRAIAAALSDVDALLATLDALIAKKRDIKQAAMQQLLSGQRRLPEFSGEKSTYKQSELGMIPNDWEVSPLGSVIERLEAGVSVNSVDEELNASTDAPSILKTSAVDSGRFLPFESKKIAFRDIHRVRFSPRADTIIISRMNTPDLVGECGYVDRDHPTLFLPDRLWMTRFRRERKVCVKWLNYLLNTRECKAKIKGAATGTSGSMKNISKDALLTILIPYPGEGEQTAIAEVLSDMDAEIAALEARREKTRALKQGMMQELLTGRIRLPVPATPKAVTAT